MKTDEELFDLIRSEISTFLPETPRKRKTPSIPALGEILGMDLHRSIAPTVVARRLKEWLDNEGREMIPEIFLLVLMVFPNNTEVVQRFVKLFGWTEMRTMMLLLTQCIGPLGPVYIRMISEQFMDLLESPIEQFDKDELEQVQKDCYVFLTMASHVPHDVKLAAAANFARLVMRSGCTPETEQLITDWIDKNRQPNPAAMALLLFLKNERGQIPNVCTQKMIHSVLPLSD